MRRKLKKKQRGYRYTYGWFTLLYCKTKQCKATVLQLKVNFKKRPPDTPIFKCIDKVMFIKIIFSTLNYTRVYSAWTLEPWALPSFLRLDPCSVSLARSGNVWVAHCFLNKWGNGERDTDTEDGIPALGILQSGNKKARRGSIIKRSLPLPHHRSNKQVFSGQESWLYRCSYRNYNIIKFSEWLKPLISSVFSPRVISKIRKKVPNKGLRRSPRNEVNWLQYLFFLHEMEFPLLTSTVF